MEMTSNFIENFIASSLSYSSKVAVVFGDTALTYQQLNERSNQLALYLLSKKVAAEEIIPLILNRDLNTIISLLGILKAGCAFLPISPITPCSRINYILNDTKAKILVTNSTVDKLSFEHVEVIHTEQIPTSNTLYTLPATPASQLAYVMYTSGSTGNPKGVLIEQGSMMNLFSSLIALLEVSSQDTILALTDYTFDISLIELLMPLLCGATIILTEQGSVADGLKIKTYLEKKPITLMQATPLTWEILLKQGWKNKGDMKILVGGEKFKTPLAEMLNYTHHNIWNMYGPTETSMWSMYYHLNDTITSETVSLGSALQKTNIYLLDEQGNFTAKGEAGEIHIGGVGLARGYLNNPELTAQKFIYHPQTGIRLYKTGDLGIQYDEQTLCYIGRTDDQLKYGGIRIEAGEIEAVIEQEPLVKKAIVKIHETKGYYKTLVAYVEIDEEKIFSSDIQSTSGDTSSFLKNIYDDIYLHAHEFEQGEINTCGWQSSFTGRVFNTEELYESYSFIRKTISTADLSEVLEVGCGTGSLLFEYVDKVDSCTIVEISTTAIDYVKGRLSAKQLQKVSFKNESVLNIHSHEKYSCIIINSVIQYLPSIHSLITAIKQLVAATKHQGTIIIGDVRALELMETYLLEKIRVNSSAETILANLSTFHYKSRDAEIVLSPMFFYALQQTMPEISHIDFSVKQGKFINELNNFRFDVILHIAKPVEKLSPVQLNFAPNLSVRNIRQICCDNPGKPIVIKEIPNPPLLQLVNNLHSNIPNKTMLPIMASQEERSITPCIELLESEIPGYEKYIHYDEKNPVTSLTIHYYPQHKDKLIRCAHLLPSLNYRTFCREPFNPWLQKFCFNHIKLKVSQQVISWVNPSAYVWVEKWPITTNGKLDKKQLHLPLNKDEKKQEELSIIEQLQIMWRNITGNNALIDKEFWNHGVSSLCMYFFLATINETFLVNISYHEFHEYNTLEKLSKHIQLLLDLPA